MSNYNGRRGPNVSQYLANLNTIPSPSDSPDDAQPLDDDFALFMNASEFLEPFDGSSSVPLDAPLDFDLEPMGASEGEADSVTAHDSPAEGLKEPKMDLTWSGDFQFTDFADFSHPIVDPALQSLPHTQTASFPVAPTFALPPLSATASPAADFDAATGKKRKLDFSPSSDLDGLPVTDEAARVAAEEDKRRRNTAASARFRIKKKQREQVLEKTAKEMTERVSVLETRIQQLETENQWLKGLITEKSGRKKLDANVSPDVKAGLERREESSGERSTGNRSDGVGTKGEAVKA